MSIAKETSRMKNLLPNACSFQALLILGIMAIAPGILANETGAKRLSEPVAVTATHELFGATLPDHGTHLSLNDLIKNSDKYQEREVLLATRVAKVCQKKGCFFVAQEGAATARVSFKDYGFFIPTDSGGKNVVLLGTFSRKSVSEKEAQHYDTDLGETAPSSPERFQYSIVATAVEIPRS
jgi:hypothetical protein